MSAAELPLDELFGPVIYAYTRAQAIEDGVLVDVTVQAGPTEMMGGFSCPVALTRAVWEMVEAIPRGSFQDVRGRLHDVLWMAANAARAGQSERRFALILPVKGSRIRNRVLKVALGPGDAGEPVVTIMLPEED